MNFRRGFQRCCSLGLIALALSSCAGPVVHTSTQPVAVFQVRPQYPFEMRRARQEGVVTVGFIVDPAGATRELYVVRSSRKEFEQAALVAVAKWKFKPGTVDGRPVYVKMQVPISFTLDDDPAVQNR